MDRPIYESEADQKAELGVARFVARAFGGEMIKNESLAPIDYRYISKDGVESNVEIKCRKIDWGVYPDIILSAEKFAYAMGEYKRHGTEFKFIVDCENMMAVFTATKDNIEFLHNRWGGRSDRGDAQDMEWVIAIPIELFWVFHDKITGETKKGRVQKDTEGSEG